MSDPQHHFSNLVDDGGAAKAEPEQMHRVPREGEAYFRQLADSMPQLAWMARADGWIFWYNRRWYEYTGSTAEQMAGWGWQSVHDPSFLPNVMSRWKHSIDTGASFELEFPLKRADGRFRWFLTRVAPLKDDAGNIQLWFGTNTDIEDRRQMAAEREEVVRTLEAERANLAALVEKAPAFMATLRGPNHVIELANEQYYKLIKRRNVIGKTVIAAIPEVKGQGFIELLDEVYRTGEPFVGKEVPVTLGEKGEAEIHVVNFVYQVLRGADAAVCGIFVHGVDVTDLVRTRETAQASERQRRLALEAAELGAWHIDARTLALTSDERFRAILGVSSKEVAYEQALAVVHPEDRARVRLAMETSMRARNRIPFAEEYRLIHSDGSIRWAYGKGKAHFSSDDPACMPSSLDGTVADITDRKRAEEEQQRLAEQRRLALDAAELGWWRLDADSGTVTWDDRVRAIFAAPEATVSHEQVIALIHPEDRERVNAATRAATRAENPLPYAVEYRIIRPNGDIRWVRAHGQAYFAGDRAARHYTSFVGAIADVTEERAARDAIRQSEAEFRQLADAMPQIVWAARPDGVLNYYNKRWFEYINRSEDAGDSIAWDRCVHPEDLGAVYERWSASLQSGEPYSAEFRVRNGAGEYRSFLVRALPVRDDDGAIVRWFGTCTDIEDRRRLEAEREHLLASERAARTESDRQSRIKDEFLATLSHEIRTPLNAILGWSQIIRGSTDLKDVGDGLQVIERNARAQARIVDDLLDMSRIISGKVRLDVQRLDLAAAVQSAVDAARPTAEAKGVRLGSVIDPLDGVAVSGDSNRLQQILWNLISNAIKFTPRHGQVRVVLERVNSHLQISVIDTGEGISLEFLPFVFDRFRQADASTTRRHGGLGLGLSIVKELVELHGGNIRVQSQGAGKGATFIVALPLLPMLLDDDPQPPGLHPRVSRGMAGMEDICNEIAGVRIVVVDDEADARALLVRLLQGCKAVVSPTGSADEAVRMVATGSYDVLISDIGMPGEDGYSLIRRVRQLGKGKGGDIPAIALTAYARAEDRVKAIAAGFQMHVAKPVEPIELVTMVAGAAGRLGTR